MRSQNLNNYLGKRVKVTFAKIVRLKIVNSDIHYVVNETILYASCKAFLILPGTF